MTETGDLGDTIRSTGPHDPNTLGHTIPPRVAAPRGVGAAPPSRGTRGGIVARMRRAHALLGVLALIARPAAADDWRNLRRDPQRTGHSVGRTNLPQPTIRWRHYLGGSLRQDQYLIDDVDADGTHDVVYLAGARVICKHVDDALVWESELLEARTLVGVTDLDGDRAKELVVIGDRGAVLVLDGRNGRVLWELPAALRGLSGNARVADLDGDGRDDLYVGQCTNNPQAAYGYTFRAGFAAARELWRISAEGGRCGTNLDVIGDLDGDGGADVVMDSPGDTLQVFDARTGAMRFSIAPPTGAPSFRPVTQLLLRNLDDDPALELLTVTNGYLAFATPPVGARRLAAYDLAGGAATLRWEYSAPRPANGNVAFHADSVADLDGDGHPEVVAGFFDGDARTWSLTVRDGRTGAERARRDDTQLLGSIAVDASGRPTVLALDHDRALVGLDLRDDGLRARFTLPALRTVDAVDWSVAPREAVSARPLQLQFDDDAAPELVLAPFDPSLPPESRLTTSLVAYDLDGAAPRALGTFAAASNSTVLTAQRGHDLSRPYAQTVVVTSDGYLSSLDREMRSTNRLVNAEFTIPGMRVGGYYGGPSAIGASPVGNTAVVGSLPGVDGADERAVVVRDSRPVLVRLDATRASLAAPPRVRWERARAAWPCLADLDGDGHNEVAAIEGRDLVAIDGAEGARARWTLRDAAGPVGTGIIGDVLPMRRAGVSGHDVMFFARAASGEIRPSQARGVDGALRWNSFSRAPHSGFGAYAVADLTGDGTDDVVTAYNSVLLFDGGDGALAREWGNAPYTMPMVAPFSGSEPEVLLFAQARSDALLSRALAPRGVDAGPSYTAPWGAAVRCLGEAAVAHVPLGTSELRVSRPQRWHADGTAAPDAVVARAVVAGGQSYATAELVPATARQGALSNVTSVDDLDGMGHAGVLVGSSDGWLYALDACTLALRWSLNFRYPVGEPIVADANGDGVDDVLVGVGDGYLYALAPRTLPAPTEVRDVAPPGDARDVDVDESETFNTLHAAWPAVPGVTRYQVRVITAAGTALGFPEYVEVSDTSTRLTDLALRLGGTYRVGVVAVGSDGSSVEALSDGVTVVDRTPPTVRFDVMAPALITPQRSVETADVLFDDATGLASTRVTLRAPDGATLLTVDDSEFRTPLPSRRVPFTWTDPTTHAPLLVAPGTYTLTATARDVGGHVTTAETQVRVQLVVTLPPTGTSSGGGGCGCRAQRVPRGAWALTACAMVLLAARRRRRCA